MSSYNNSILWVLFFHLPRRSQGPGKWNTLSLSVWLVSCIGGNPGVPICKPTTKWCAAVSTLPFPPVPWIFITLLNLFLVTLFGDSGGTLYGLLGLLLPNGSFLLSPLVLPQICTPPPKHTHTQVHMTNTLFQNAFQDRRARVSNDKSFLCGI